MAGPFEARYPDIARWVRDGWVELGRDEHSHSFVRVLDAGGLVWEGKEQYKTVGEALAEAEAAVDALKYL